MLLKHFFTEKIAHSSYMLIGQDTCAVIDPQRDVDHYIEEARSQGVKITHICQTHLHADFISGHMDLAEKTGAQIYVAKSAACTFDHVPLSEGDVIELEDMRLQVLETPGHTPEHLSYVVADTSRTESPVGVFVGDTLFVGDVGRPDLFPNRARELAEKLYHSLHDKLLKLPDYCEVYPAHGAGSLCGRAMGAKWRSTIGYERNFNDALLITDKEAFITSLTENMPEAPDHFSRCSDINRRGPVQVKDLPPLAELRPDEFQKIAAEPDTIVLDTRSYMAFGGQHVKSSWHLDLNGNFPTFAGWVLPTDKKILLVADDYDKAKEAVIWARRTGVDNIVGYLEGSLSSWSVTGLPSGSVYQMAAEDLHEWVTGEDDFVLLDVRAVQEYEDSHIKGSVNIPVAALRTRYDELDPFKTTVVVCSSGNRSSLGTSILKQHGFKDLINLVGGMSGYSAAGYAKECRACASPHGSRFFTGYRKNPL
ncbi:MBL fold metallo-hydrolase [Anoxynatronum buryatiense]|uniref:Glyoxylase, beta-lactamase superfamily II n=1 Tax=Anoxynatronum buryatiense TaxID=489973 RepID=A0AA46AIV0_9CLOT|nr:MBL fold metallo-hydrolase [Anoxynatronum buryatiense]SMP53690.1 Glyoxylase, beta-lactamase superfamily II [Anoxynatronum buryatiense]